MTDAVKGSVLSPDDSIRIHEQQVLTDAVVFAGQNELAVTADRFADQEVTVFGNKSLAFAPTDGSVKPVLGFQLFATRPPV